MSAILDAREERSLYVKNTSIKYYNKVIIVLKSNTPGKNKNTNNSKFLIKIFDNLLSSLLKETLLHKEKINSLDGDYFLFVVDDKKEDVKRLAHYIETYHPLGKFVDIDVYFDLSPLSRQSLTLSERKCFVCDEYARVCTRNKTHKLYEINKIIKKSVNKYLVDQVLFITDNAIVSELDLHPKFGLVSKVDSGCHTDMDYSTFINSKKAIKPYLKEYIESGLKPIDPFKLQEIGLGAEKAMFERTKNINTHKGLIFLLGVFLPPLVESILKDKKEKYLIKNIKKIALTILNEYYDSVNEKDSLSNSDIIYQEYNIKGIREEAMNGLESLFDKQVYENTLDSLMYFMSVLDDTTIIHKTSLKVLFQVKREMNSILSGGGYLNNKAYVTALSNDYKKQSISPGGSADMLVLSIIYEQLKWLLKKTE